jgi:hypothetical protein
MCLAGLAALMLAAPIAASPLAEPQPSPVSTAPVQGSIVSSADRPPLSRARIQLTSLLSRGTGVALSAVDGTYRTSAR